MKYNYHTHTGRCPHAEGGDEAYIQEAVKAGFQILGFADHCPWPGIYDTDVRMAPELLEDYVNSLRHLKEKYRDRLELHIGLECEYFPQHLPWLLERKETLGIEYLILGHHFWPPEERGAYYNARNMDSKRIALYGEGAAEAIESGLFLYLAHPDLFMKGYTDGGDIRPVCRLICRTAKQAGLPLEFNLLGLRRSGLPVTAENCESPALFSEWLSGRYLAYPYPVFWEEAALAGCRAVIGVDAHAPEQLQCEPFYRCASFFLRELAVELTEPKL